MAPARCRGLALTRSGMEPGRNELRRDRDSIIGPEGLEVGFGAALMEGEPEPDVAIAVEPAAEDPGHVGLGAVLGAGAVELERLRGVEDEAVREAVLGADQVDLGPQGEV